MVIVFLYGPPAVGKLTVARHIAKMTEYKIFHNHHTVDLALSLFDFSSEPFDEICSELRIKTFEIAAKHELDGLIFTFCYEYPIDTPFVQQVKQVVSANNGSIVFAQLLCNLEELKHRVVSDDRKEYAKIQSVQGLLDAYQRWNLTTPIPDSNTLCIDNTQMSPFEVAKQIIAHFQLPCK